MKVNKGTPRPAPAHIPSSAERHGGRKVELLSTQNIPLNRPQVQAQRLAQQTAAQPTTLPASQTPAVEGTAPSYSERDPAYMPVVLPSKFSPYTFKTLSLKTLQGSHISKLHRAHKEESLRLIVEAIGSTLEPGLSAFDLTPADFYFLMYWQRVNSYPKNRLLVETYCTNVAHNDEVLIGVKDPQTGQLMVDPVTNQVIKKDRETLKIEDYVTMTTLEIKELEPFYLEPYLGLVDKYEIGVETMRDVVDALDIGLDMAQAGDETVTDFMYTAARAAFLRRGPGRMTLKERCLIVDQMSADEVMLLDEYREKITSYGVAEYANVRCKECGASTKLKVSFDALTFLSGRR